MAEKILGPHGSKRRKRFLWVPVLLIACTALFVVVGAQAVHDEHVFQLDGNGLNTVGSTPAMPSAPEDADNICAANPVTVTNPTGCVKSSSNSATSTTATKSTFVTDAFFSATDNIYTTGGSKDDLDIPSWKFKTAQPSPDKADIEHGFLGLYTAGNGDKLAYFGGDRFSNGGDENTAFWLFQSPVGLAGDGTSGNPPKPDPSICATASGCSFTGSHTAAVPGGDGCLTPVGQTQGVNITATKASNVPCTESDNGTGNPSTDKQGDILIVSAFTTGGTVPTISVYEWVGDHAINAKTGLCVTADCSVLTRLNANPGCSANSAVTGDFACAITDQAVTITGSCPTGNPLPPCPPGNTIPVSSPWTYTEKSSDNSTTGASPTQDKWLDGVYLEGGLNLTALGLQNECTSSFLMNTRSSQSVDASLQDFALGQVGSCVTTLTTKAGDTANGGTASPTSIGTGSVSSGSDTATLGISGVDTWGGTLTWYLCGPLASLPASGPNCDNTKGLLVTSRTVSQASSASAFVSGTATLTEVGQYCWTAHFAPDTTTAGKGVKPADDTGAQECFTVSPVTPTVTTAAVAHPVGLLSPTVFGGLADLNGDGSGSSDPTADNSTAFYGSTNIINGKLDCNAWGATKNAGTAGDGVIDTSDDCQLLGYDGTANGVTINVVDGAFQVPNGTALPAIFPNPATPNDNSIINAKFAWSTRDGRVDANGDGAITGDDCSINVVNGYDILGSVCQGYTIPQGNGLVDLNDDGKLTSADTCSNGCFLGHNVRNGFVITGPVDFGQAIYDVATLSGTATQKANNGVDTNYPSIICNGASGAAAGTNVCTAAGSGNGANAGGKITFTLRGPNDCTVTANSQDVSPISGDGTYGPVSFTPTAPGTYYWQAQYFTSETTGDANTLNSALDNSACDIPGETVVVRQIPTDVKTKQSWYPNDTATITSTAAGNNLGTGGTVVFTLYDTGNCTGNVLYKETKTNVGGAHSVELSTGNPGSGDTGTTSYLETSAYTDGANSSIGPRSWKVVYTVAAGDTSHTGSSSTCTTGHTESHTYTYQNDPGH